MEAHTSSCSNAIVDRLGSYSPRDAAYVSNRPQFCFSSNDKKGCNFRFLKLVQNKGIYPIYAVLSKTQVDLDSADLEAQQTNESKIIHVKFQLQQDCNFGEQFQIVGDDPIFGSWDPSNALPMTWSEGNIWTVEQDIPAGKTIQFKFILKREEGDIIWQPGSDRIIHTWETMNSITVCEDWENAQLQKIIEEDQLAHSNEKYQVDSEMSNFADNSGIEGSQTHAMEKPLAEPDMQHITTDNISSSMEKPMAISSRKNKKNMIHLDEKSATTPGNNAKTHSHKGQSIGL